ncbi:Porphobilinogen deaminase [Neorhodopirellula pilleata]|uniref:Hydroxymethylbilane synthase n=2 Tax=Neorhodopirellula pilleata TaxID=2714738 RepID=A0A5C6A515_9BACT|nr:Porphobilinogen deaminase [Neorhodopirellula pilleata]
MWQAEYVASRLASFGFESVLVPLVSGGDTDMRPIDGTRQVGVFTKRIQQALVDDEADVAVHSLKDLPTAHDPRFHLAAVPERETVLDTLVTLDGRTLSELPAGAKVGTGSTRRMAQLKALRGDLDIQPIRGNVQTRLSKLRSGEFDAIVLAEAGVVRLEMHDLPRSSLSLVDMLPAPGQGALGIEVRSEDHAAVSAVGRLNDRSASFCVTVERTVLAELHGGCLAPIAAHAITEPTNEGAMRLSITARVMSADGQTCLHETANCKITPSDSLDRAKDLGRQIAEKLKTAGAEALIQASRPA